MQQTITKRLACARSRLGFWEPQLKEHSACSSHTTHIICEVFLCAETDWGSQVVNQRSPCTIACMGKTHRGSVITQRACFTYTRVGPSQEGWARGSTEMPFVDVSGSHESCAESRLTDLLMALP